MSAISKVVYGNQTLIDLTADTVEAGKLASGYTAHGADGEPILGTCTFDADTSDADAVASNILENKTAYVSGNKVTGNMPNRGSVTLTIDDVDDELSIQSGYHDGTGVAKLDATEKAKIVEGNIKSGVSILGVLGTYTGEAGQGEIKNITPYTTAQTVLPGTGYDYITQVNVAAIYYNETQNSGGGLTATIGTVAPTT